MMLTTPKISTTPQDIVPATGVPEWQSRLQEQNRCHHKRITSAGGSEFCTQFLFRSDGQIIDSDRALIYLHPIAVQIQDNIDIFGRGFTAILQVDFKHTIFIL